MLTTSKLARGPTFDVHLDALIDVTVRLVNSLTGSCSRGRRQAPAVDSAQVDAVAAALAGEDRRRPSVTPQEAKHLAQTAGVMRRIFDLVSQGDVAGAATVVNDLMRSTGARPELIAAADGSWSLHFRGRDDTLAVGWAAGCASSLAIAIGSDLSGRLGVCAAVRCDQVFVDQSRNRVRRFCSLDCQNRTKSASFRSRR